ncbi:N-acetyltransferase [Lottiidibacillus patelloidae]|uniref:N-acetyltransferase n=1 Tax=Lottiidibacillus patelloidae TaxID=2670334 RepID=A0A263BR70_9BACI|nr:N-acetyltransferase [Lottiidibacillus patelloidae]
MRKFEESDWEQVKIIYELGIKTGQATFEIATPSLEYFVESAVKDCLLVAHDNQKILGWCKLSRTSNREVYRGVGEVSIYVHPNASGKGTGSKLLQALITCSEDKGFWTLFAGIFPENKTSIHLHKKFGFQELGIQRKIGRMKGVWRVVVMFERRSTVVGNNE